jgi:hypothetical protein
MLDIIFDKYIYRIQKWLSITKGFASKTLEDSIIMKNKAQKI